MRYAVVACAAALLAAPAAAQTVTLDEGTFRVLMGGREVGMETFSIRQSGSGADMVIIAQGQVSLESTGQMSAQVQVSGTELRPVAYDIELKGADARLIRAFVTGSRARARTVSPAGETMREYLVSQGAVLVDDDVAHHYWFVARQALGGATRVPLMNPRESRQVQATLTLGGEESVNVAGRTVRARRLTVQPAGGDARHAWIDDNGRVLRVEMAARGYTAVRTSLPQ